MYNLCLIKTVWNCGLYFLVGNVFLLQTRENIQRKWILSNKRVIICTTIHCPKTQCINYGRQNEASVWNGPKMQGSNLEMDWINNRLFILEWKKWKRLDNVSQCLKNWDGWQWVWKKNTDLACDWYYNDAREKRKIRWDFSISDLQFSTY